MKSVILLAVVLFAFGINAIPQPIHRRSGRVAGGTPATAGQATHAVVILVVSQPGDTQVHLGGGSIIADRQCITAAHLVANRGPQAVFQMAYGGVELRTLRRVDATSVSIAANYDPATLENDLAIITNPVNRPFVFRVGHVTAIRVSIAEGGPSSGTTLQLAGFGFTAANSGAMSETLNIGDQTVTDEAACTAALDVETLVTHFCAQGSAGVAACPGDNGCGLYETVTEGEETFDVLHGVASRIPPECDGAVPTAFTGCSFFANWLGGFANQTHPPPA